MLGIDDPVDVGATLRRTETRVLVALVDATVVGCAYGHELVHPDGERTMLLYSLDVAEPHRRRGVGRALTSAFVAGARAEGCTEVWVLTEEGNVAANATYAAAGATREGEPPVMFAWRLADGHHTSP